MVSLELDRQLVEHLQAYVASNEYPDASSAIRAGLRWIRTRVELNDDDRSIQEMHADYDEQNHRQILINLDGDVVERIQALVDEQSEFADESAVVSKALFLLEERKKLVHLRKLIAEAEEDFAHGRFTIWKPGMMQELLELGRQRARDGLGPNPDVL